MGCEPLQGIITGIESDDRNDIIFYTQVSGNQGNAIDNAGSVRHLTGALCTTGTGNRVVYLYYEQRTTLQPMMCAEQRRELNFVKKKQLLGYSCRICTNNYSR